MVKIHFDPKYQFLEQDILHFLKNFRKEGEYIKKGSRNVIKKIELNGTNLNVKSFKKPSLIKGIIYRFFRVTKAERSFNFAKKLLSKGIGTPEPICYIVNQNGFRIHDSYYISIQLNYDFDFRYLIHNPWAKNRTLILQKFTDFTYKLHENSINFLDHSPGNTLIIDQKNDTYGFYLIDLNRMRFEKLSLKQRMENLKRLWLSSQMITIVAKRYAEISKIPYQEVFQELNSSSRKFKIKLHRKRFLKKKFLFK